MNAKLMERIKITKPVVPEHEALTNKLKRLETRIFGVKISKFELISNDYVYVPYIHYRYAYDIKRKGKSGKPAKLNRKGVVDVIFDLNEAHPFECDMEEIGALDLLNLSQSGFKGRLVAPSCTDYKALQKTETFIQDKILRRLYASRGEVKLLDKVNFFRPAICMSIRYKGSNVINNRFAYLDAYGVENEHILGLRFRMRGG
jgi:hypothetical protein